MNLGHRRKAVPFSLPKEVRAVRKLMWFTLGFAIACAWGAYFANEYFLVIGIAAAALTLTLGLLCKKRSILRPAAMVCLGCCIVIG